jgi:hypothetical protein
MAEPPVEWVISPRLLEGSAEAAAAVSSTAAEAALASMASCFMIETFNTQHEGDGIAFLQQNICCADSHFRCHHSTGEVIFNR